jgi:uncharacterized protein YecE (DUF72 family)
VEPFLDNIEPLLDKTLVLLIQLPPSMEIMPGLEGFRNAFIWITGSDMSQVKHHSWFQDMHTIS